MNRRGSIYILVLGLSLVLTLIGLATLAAGRIGSRTMTDSQDWIEAQALAHSAADHAMLLIAQNSDWRTTCNNATISRPLGRGTFTWRLVDEEDGNLLDNASQPFAIIATGVVGRASYTLRVHMTGGSVGGLTSGLTVSTEVTLNSGARVDSYDSRLGPYGGSNIGADATVRTNSTSAGTVLLGANARINGSVEVGPGGNPNQVVNGHRNSTITGTKTAMSAPVQMPTVSAPTGLGPSTGNQTYSSNESVMVSSNMHVNNLTLSSNSKVRINGDVTIWAEGNFSVASNSYIEILSGSSLTLYVGGTISISSNGAVRNNTPNVSSAKLISLSGEAVTVSSNGSIQAVIIAPDSTVTLSSNSELTGAVVARNVSLSSGAEFHEDKNITSLNDPVDTGGQPSPPRPVGWSRVVE